MIKGQEDQNHRFQTDNPLAVGKTLTVLIQRVRWGVLCFIQVKKYVLNKEGRYRDQDRGQCRYEEDTIAAG